MERVVYCINHGTQGMIVDDWKEIEISRDLHVYPCCTLHAFHFLDGTFYDEYLDGLPKNWNSLKHHTMEEIIKTFREYITPEKWQKLESTPQCCKKLCLLEERKDYES